VPLAGVYLISYFVYIYNTGSLQLYVNYTDIWYAYYTVSVYVFYIGSLYDLTLFPPSMKILMYNICIRKMLRK